MAFTAALTVEYCPEDGDLETTKQPEEGGDVREAARTEPARKEKESSFIAI
jgi:hypothetical protein